MIGLKASATAIDPRASAAKLKKQQTTVATATTKQGETIKMKQKQVVCLTGVNFGGNANNGANCGFAYANTNNAPSNTNANIGSRLYF